MGDHSCGERGVRECCERSVRGGGSGRRSGRVNIGVLVSYVVLQFLQSVNPAETYEAVQLQRKIHTKKMKYMYISIPLFRK